MRKRLAIIGMCLLLMFGAVYIVGTTMYQEREDLPVARTATDPAPSIPIERGVFERSWEALAYQQMPEGNRSLANMASNRAYPGAPPMIPHAQLSEKGIGDIACLQCHQNGGYTEQFQAFAPVTPHPEFINCKQCHLPQKTNQIFKSSNWQKMQSPKIKQVALVGGPPVIPHGLQLRENCLSCHAGPAARKEIRTTHPERINCRQCHLSKNASEIFIKPPAKTDIKSTDNSIGDVQYELNGSEISQIEDWLKTNTNDYE